jgi:hypothetical protein
MISLDQIEHKVNIRTMTNRRFAIITYDPERVANLNWQAEGSSFGYAIWRGVNGFTYAKERGLINITIMDEVKAVAAPNDWENRQSDELTTERYSSE